MNRTPLQKAGELIAAARSTFEAAGYEVQSTRLATVPFGCLLLNPTPAALIDLALELETAARSYGFEYISLGPATPESIQTYELIPDVLGATSAVFMTGLMTSSGGRVLLDAVWACAEVIHGVAGLTPDGFTNLRFAALANVPAGVPFLPAAYAEDDRLAFALAIEAADLAVEAVQQASGLEDARQQLVKLIETHAAELSRLAHRLEERLGAPFRGIDFTLAPFPKDAFSIGAAIEKMGVPAVGGHGSLAAAAFLTDSIDRAKFQRAGFSGLFFPVLEDSVLARRATQGLLSIKDLLLFSAVCGSGLDCVPLAGETSVGQLYAVLLDLATLAQRLDKPLTARLMPIPGKRVGDPVDFDFPYFANSRVMALEAEPLDGLFCSSESFSVRPRIK